MLYCVADEMYSQRLSKRHVPWKVVPDLWRTDNRGPGKLGWRQLTVGPGSRQSWEIGCQTGRSATRVRGLSYQGACLMKNCDYIGT